jgi:hypothetical protein
LAQSALQPEGQLVMGHRYSPGIVRHPGLCLEILQ